MSYSFSVKAATKAAALAAIAAEFDKVVAGQPVHVADRQQAEAAAGSMLAVFPEATDDQEVSVSVSGWLSWNGAYPNDHVISQAQVSVTVKVGKRA